MRRDVSETCRFSASGACAVALGAAAIGLAALVPLAAGPPGPPTAELSEQETAPAAETPQDRGTAREEGWIRLFDGETLKGWEISNFGGEGDVRVEDGRILLEMGNDLTGIHTKRELPKIDYEVELEAMRVDGGDFFCGLTFPVGGSPCSLIIGGWGGGLCGLSSLDGFDASENETARYREFKNGEWYRIRLRVTAKRIEAWIGDEQIINQDITDRRLSIRIEVEPSKPFGIASWRTTAAVRNLRLRPLEPAAAD